MFKIRAKGLAEKIVFLDRDGVINKDPQAEYVTSPEEFKFIPGALEALRKLSDGGYKIFIISNQQGVGKGIFSQKTLDEITAMMLEAMKKKGIKIGGVYYCTHREEENCLCRKPKTGLLEAAVGKLNPDLKKTFFVGDTERDIKTGKAADCKTILALSGKTKSSDAPKNWQAKPDYIFDDLKEAAKFILHLS